ncbi:MAG: M24 family metallopeptidase [Pseudomonadota bacterium]|nr:M24 family metallopeptidase [Pseudomonadota bacterium]
MTHEIDEKLRTMRAALTAGGLGALRLRGVDWFAWATGGGSSVVNLAAEVGVAEVLVTSRGAWVLTDPIEAPRLRDEELRPGFTVQVDPWAEPVRRDQFVAVEASGEVASDRPHGGERHLPGGLLEAKRTLLPAEIARYRVLGHDAAAAVTDVLTAAHPGWSEAALAGAAAEALWRQGIHPIVTLVAGAHRLPRYRHPLPTGASLGRLAMLVVCGRRGGLYANLTRFVSFGGLTTEERQAFALVARVEAAALDASRPGTRLDEVYRVLAQAYAREGRPGEEAFHHQGGTTGYLAREVVATPSTTDSLGVGSALAWNPSVVGMKIEDTVVLTTAGIEILTVDPRWPTVEVAGRARPTVWERA